MGSKCETCPMRLKAEKNPQSIMAKNLALAYKMVSPAGRHTRKILIKNKYNLLKTFPITSPAKWGML